MTGFARAEGRSGAQGWTWEVKSVNGRGLELRFRLPPGFDAVELPARTLIGERLKRGNINVNLQMQSQGSATTYRVNKDLLKEMVDVIRDAESWIEAAPARMDGLLALRGVIEAVDPEPDEAAIAAREVALLESLVLAVDRLATARAVEGGKLTAIIGQQVDEMERLVAAAKACEATRPAAWRARLQEQLAALLDSGRSLSEERLTQELALIATKGDVREELDRLTAHIAAARELIAGGDAGGAGRRLDFLAQEFNREANTLCSKSGDVTLTRIGLDLKLTIDRFREQVQNIE